MGLALGRALGEALWLALGIERGDALGLAQGDELGMALGLELVDALGLELIFCTVWGILVDSWGKDCSTQLGKGPYGATATPGHYHSHPLVVLVFCQVDALSFDLIFCTVWGILVNVKHHHVTDETPPVAGK